MFHYLAKSKNTIPDPDCLCQQYLHIIYRQIDKQESSNNPKKKGFAYTQGEISSGSVKKILLKMNLTSEDHFLDLGSGRGKLAGQIFLQSIAKSVTGIEIIPALHKQAMLAVNSMQNHLPLFFNEERKLVFLQEDFLQSSLPPITAILINATCFGPDLMCQISEKINNMPAVRCVLSLRPLPLLKKLNFAQSFNIECSWDSARCYVYQI